MFEIHTIVSPSESSGLTLESLWDWGDAGKEEETVGSLRRKDKRRDIDGDSFFGGGSGFGEEDFGDPVLVESLGEEIVG